jgi:hypothetical protein
LGTEKVQFAGSAGHALAERGAEVVALLYGDVVGITALLLVVGIAVDVAESDIAEACGGAGTVAIVVIVTDVMLAIDLYMRPRQQPTC